MIPFMLAVQWNDMKRIHKCVYSLFYPMSKCVKNTMKPGRSGHSCFLPITIVKWSLNEALKVCLQPCKCLLSTLVTRNKQEHLLRQLLSYNLTNCHNLAFHDRLHDLPLSYKITITVFLSLCYVLILHILFY